jgi:opacity protein-like surface antigen
MTMKKTLIGAVSGAALAFAASAAPAAAEDREFGWSVTLGATSDYVFRGLSFTNEDPAAQGSIDMSYGIFYAGAWASNIDGLGFAPWELDLYAGIKPVLGPVTFDFGIVGYLYPAADTLDKEYIEFKAGGSMEVVKGLTGGVTFWYTPDSLSNGPLVLGLPTTEGYAETYSIEGTLAYALPQVGIFAPTLSGLIGYTEDVDNTAAFSNFDDSYVYWNVGLALAVEKFTMDFRYWDTNLDQIPGDVYTGLSDERFVFSAKVTLP